MASQLSAACRRSLSEWKAAHAVLADAIQIYLDATSRLDASCAIEPGPERKNDEGIWSVYKTLDGAIPTLASHEERLRNARAQLQHRRNESTILSPITKLSPDLLSQIFTLVVDSGVQTHQPTLDMTSALASVCANWRHIAISTGAIWSYVDLSRLGTFEHAAIWISRAKGCLLDIRVVPKNTSDNYAQAQTFPKQGHTVTSLPELSCPARVRSILLCEQKQLANPWLSWWFEHGAPGTVTTLALRALGALSFPMTPEATPQNRMDELLRSVGTLYLCGIGTNWDSLTFRDLTTLHLALLLDLPIQHLAQILSASPRIQSLQLAAIQLSDHGNIVLRPIQLNHLELLELSSLSNEDLIPLLNMLLPGSRQLTLRFAARWDADDDSENTAAHALVSFCRLAKVTKFCFNGPVFPQDLSALSDLEILVLKRIEIDESICDLISPRSDIDLQPLPTPLCKLHTVETPGCYFIDIGGFKRVLSVCPIRTFRFAAASVATEPNQFEDEDFESWAGAGVDFEDVCREDVVGYSPFGDYFGDW
jgi:hypothetical protein